MKNGTGWILIAGFLTVLLIFNAKTNLNGQNKPKWEYRRTSGSILQQEDVMSAINQMGEDGWELVTAFSTSAEGHVLYFKRSK